MAAHEGLYISHTFRGLGGSLFVPEEDKNFASRHSAYVPRRNGGSEMTIFDYKLGEVVVCCYDDWVTSTDRELCVLKSPVHLQ